MRYNNFRGEYDANAQYEKNDVVIFDGAAYYRLFGGKGVSPIGKARRQVWQKMNETAGDVLSLVGGPGSPSGGGGTSNAVQYIPQELTETQQMQARKNLGVYYLGGDVETVVSGEKTYAEFEEEEGVYYARHDFYELFDRLYEMLDAGPEDLAKVKLVVCFNGTRYECGATFDPAAGGLSVGNKSIIGGEDTGEPFLILYDSVYIGSNMPYTMAVYEITEGVEKIEGKYLPVADEGNRGVISYADVKEKVLLEKYIGLVYGQTKYQELMELSREYRYIKCSIGYDGKGYDVLSCVNGNNVTKIIAVPTARSSESADFGTFVELLLTYDITENGVRDDSLLKSVEVVYPKKMLLASSGGNKFEITVSDSGTLSAVPVSNSPV